MTDPIDATPDLETAYLLDLTGGDRALIDEILAAFKEDVPLRVSALSRALAAGNLAETGRLAHALKGASGSLGATCLYQRAAALEQAARGGDAARSVVLGRLVEGDLARLLARLAVEAWA